MATLIGRNGGIYIPPFKLARMKEEVTDSHSEEAQRIEWERMRKSIKGLVNKVSSSNIKSIVQEIFVEDLLRGRGLLVRSLMHAQIASPIFTNVLASLVAVINTKIPEIGDLLLRRLALQFRRAYMRNDEIVLTSICKFLAHLLNHRVVDEVVILQVVSIFLEKLSSDSIKVCCQLLFDCGEVLSKVSSKGMFFIFERLRQVLQEGSIDKRVQYSIEALFEARRKKFVDYPGLLPELDLVDETDQVTHDIDLIEGEIDGEESLNIFHALDPEAYAEAVAHWQSVSNEVLGNADEDSSADSEAASSVDSEAEDEKVDMQQPVPSVVGISDMTEQDLINLRRTIYLAIMSSANFEECVHKILSLNIRTGQEKEVVHMLLDCCSMEKTSNRFFHLQAERLCRLSRVYKNFFAEGFVEQYESMHRHETGKIRNLAKMFSHLLFTDSIDWTVLQTIRLTEEDTTSSTRIFIKILFQDLAENLGATGLLKRVADPTFAVALSGVFPTDTVANIRFSINFFTAIGLGQLTAEQRQRLNEISLRAAMEAEQAKAEMKRSPSYSSRSSSSASNRSRSRSRSSSLSYSSRSSRSRSRSRSHEVRGPRAESPRNPRARRVSPEGPARGARRVSPEARRERRRSRSRSRSYRRRSRSWRREEGKSEDRGGRQDRHRR